MTIEFTAISGSHSISGGGITEIRFPYTFPMDERIIAVGDDPIDVIVYEGETKTIGVCPPVGKTEVAFVFHISGRSGAIVGIVRKGTKTQGLFGGLKIVSENCIFQYRGNHGISTSDRRKNDPFYRLSDLQGTHFWDDAYYWALAVAAMEYGVPVVQPSSDYSSISPSVSVSPSQSGGSSIMGMSLSANMTNPWYDPGILYRELINSSWDSPYFSDPKYQIVDPTLTKETAKENFLVYKGKRILLPNRTKHIGKFDGLLWFEHANGKVKTRSALCLLDSKEHDPNLLMLVEDQIEAARALACSLEIFAEVLRQEGQVVKPNPVLDPPKKTRKRKEKTR